MDAMKEAKMGSIVFSPLAQGMLTDKYLKGVPEDSRAASGAPSFRDGFLSEANIERIRGLNSIAEKRGQTLSQMALAWVLRDPVVTTALIGASKPSQIQENVEALNNLTFTSEELAAIDHYAKEGDINIWAASSKAG